VGKESRKADDVVGAAWWHLLQAIAAIVRRPVDAVRLQAIIAIWNCRPSQSRAAQGHRAVLN